MSGEGAGAVTRQGLAAMLLRMVRPLRQSVRTERQLQLLETLHLGPKRQVMVVRCGAERFLVGAGSEGVTTMLRLERGASAGEEPL